MCERVTIHNPISRKLGLTNKQMEQEYEALEFIYSMETVFQLVMITEMMDESLIVLRGKY